MLKNLFLASILLATGLATSAQGQIYTKQFQVEGYFKKKAPFANNPKDIHVFPNGDFVVAESRRVLVSDKTGKLRSIIADIGARQSKSVRDITDIAPVSKGFYFVNWQSQSVVRINMAGDVVQTLFQRSPRPTKPGIMPDAIATDQIGNLYIADGATGTLLKYNAAGKFLSAFGKQYISDRTSSLATDRKGNLYYADGARVQMFSPQGKWLKIIAETDPSDSDQGYFDEIAIGNNGLLYALGAKEKVRIFSAAGKLVSQFGMNFENGFMHPVLVGVDGAGNVVVSSQSSKSAIITKYRRRQLAP